MAEEAVSQSHNIPTILCMPHTTRTEELALSATGNGTSIATQWKNWQGRAFSVTLNYCSSVFVDVRNPSQECQALHN